MKKPEDFYKVTITELYQKEVWVKAESPENAKKKVEKEYRGYTHILQSGDYKGTMFSAEQEREEVQK